MAANLKVVKGASAKPSVRVGFGVRRTDRAGKRQPPCWFYVTTSRPRAPFVLDLRLWVNPEPDTSWRAP